MAFQRSRPARRVAERALAPRGPRHELEGEGVALLQRRQILVEAQRRRAVGARGGPRAGRRLEARAWANTRALETRIFFQGLSISPRGRGRFGLVFGPTERLDTIPVCLDLDPKLK